MQYPDISTEVFSLALRLEDPWYVSKIDFSLEKSQLDIYVDYQPGMPFTCSECGEQSASVHDVKEKTWRHLNFFQYKCYVHCRTPRIYCPKCGVHLVDVPWSRKGSGFTLMMEGMILLLAKEMTVSALGKYINETDKRVFRVLRYYVKQAHEKQDCSVITSICVDETASKKGHNYITVFSDVDTGRVVYVTPGKDASTIDDFRNFLLTHNGNPNQIHSVCCDMSPAFIGGVENIFPDASIVFDKFHLMLIVNKTVNEIRIEEIKTTNVLKKTKYLFLKNPENLTEKERRKLDSIVCQNLKTAKAYHIRLNFQELWKCRTPGAAEKFLKQWYFWITHSKIPQMKELAKTIKRHWKGIINYFFAHVTNGILEGINGMIQNIKREARGYKNIGNFITMIYLRLGGLELEVPMLKA